MLTAWARSPAWSGRVGWLSLDETDNEPIRFWTYALSALDRVAPELTRDSFKGYTKSLYRKLGVVTRADAVRRGHELGPMRDGSTLGSPGLKWCAGTPRCTVASSTPQLRPANSSRSPAAPEAEN